MLKIIYVRRKWKDRRTLAVVHLGKIEEIHWNKTSSHIKSLRPQLFICGYVLCTDLGDFCSLYGPHPHKIKVYVMRRDNKETWDELISIVGSKPKLFLR